MGMSQDTLKGRTKDFAKQIIVLCRLLPHTREGKLIGDQIFRSGTSVGANYRAACRARSRAEFIAKLGIVLEETDETLYWLEILMENQIIKPDFIITLMRESNELISVFVASLKSAKR